MSVDAVLSYHTSPYSCGVAKWSIRLARELGVPFGQLAEHARYRHPLLSFKHAEFPLYRLRARAEMFDLFLHDFVGGPLVERWWRENHPITVYAANAVIARELQRYRPDVITAWCPSTIDTPPPRAALTVLTFGFAHKRTAPHFERLKTLLDAHGEPYTILASTAVHEGSPWDRALEESTAVLRDIFGERLEMLGFLSDAALDREIRAATACAVFYEPALRENNTSAWAVLERGTPLISNLDRDSPGFAIHDINTMGKWHQWGRDWPKQGLLGWSDLLTVLCAEVPCAK